MSSPPKDKDHVPEDNKVLDELFSNLSNKLSGLSSEIFAKMDEMARRIDNLEAELRSVKDKQGDEPPSSSK